MAANIVWGLDIGSSAIKAVKMQRFGTECSIVDFDIIDIPGGDDPAERPARLNVAMKNLIDTHKFGTDPVYLAIPGAVCLHREFSLPPTAASKLQEMVQFEAKQQIPFPLDQVEWGYEQFETGEGFSAINVTLIAVRKSDIQELLSLSENFNLKLEGIVPAPVSLYNFINFEFKPQQITLILDAGARGTDFVVMNKRQIYFRSIQIAGREITRVLENKFKVPYDKAESLKKNIEKSPQMEQILTVIEPTLRNLGADVQRTIGFYKAKSRGQRIQQCYLLGHAFRLPKMAEFLQMQVREAPFALVEGLQRIRLGSSVDPTVWEHEFPTMAVAIGLGIQGLALSELKLNLIPREKEGEIARAQWKKWAAASVAAVLLTAGLTYYFSSKADTEYRAAAISAEDEQKKIADSANKEKAVVAAIPEKSDVLKRLERSARDRGKEQAAYSAVLEIKNKESKTPLFSLNNHIHVTSLYVSRAPLARENKYNPERFDRVDKLEGLKRLYASLNVGPDPIALAPELRPDAPLLVLISGEAEIIGGNQGTAQETINAVVAALKELPQCKDKQVEAEIMLAAKFVREDHRLYYDLEGKLKTEVNPAEPQEVLRPEFIPFYIMFAWEDPEDKDRAPEVPAEKTPATK
jgi:type IV pilus assembly protein PilM